MATALTYWLNFTLGAGADVTVIAGDRLALAGTASLAGLVSGAGTLALSGASALQAGAAIGVAFWNVTGANTTVTVGEALTYSGAFAEGLGAKLSIGAGDALTLAGASSLAGSIGGAGTLSLTSGATTVLAGATIGAAFWNVTGTGTTLTLGGASSYAGGFTASDGALIDLTTGALTLTGPSTFSGVEVSGAAAVRSYGSTALAGLDLAAASAFANFGSVIQSGDVTVGDSNASDRSYVNNAAGAVWRISNDSGIALGADQASNMHNSGLFEKTAGSGVSTVALAETNDGSIWVGSGTLDFQGVVMGLGSDTISGAAHLEFDSTVSAWQSIDFVGSGGDLILGAPTGFSAHISGFDATGSGSNDTVQLSGAWTLGRFVENAAGTGGTLNLTSGASQVGLYFVGAYGGGHFAANPGTGGGTLITYA